MTFSASNIPALHSVSDTGHTTDHNSIRQVLLDHDNILTYSASLQAAILDETGSGSLVFNTNPVFNTSASIGSNAITTTANAFTDHLGTVSSSVLALRMTDETGSGSLVFNTSPIFTGTVNLGSNTATGSVQYAVSAGNATGGSSSSITASAGTVGGWIISPSSLYNNSSGSSYAGLQSASASPYAFFAGASSSAGASPTFYVTPAGTLTSNSASIAGVVTFTSGTIGPFTVSSTLLSGSSGNITASNTTLTGNLTASSGTTTLGTTNVGAFTGTSASIGVSGSIAGIIVSSSHVEFADPFLYIGTSNASAYDVGFYGHTSNPSYNHFGLARFASDNIWRFFSNVSEPPENSASAQVASANYDIVRMGGLQIYSGSATQSASIDSSGNISASTTKLSGATSGTTTIKAQDVAIGNIATLPVGNVKIAGANFDYATATTTNSSSTAYVAPTGFAGFTVYPNRAYTFEVNVFYQVSVTSTGLRSRFTYPTLTAGAGTATMPTSVGAPTVPVTALTTGSTTFYMGNASSASSTATIYLKGFIIPSASGTLAFDFVTSASGTASVVAGSWFTMTEVE